MSQDLPGMVPALEEALKSARFGARHAATIALARRYAALMDEPSPAAKYRRPLELLTHAVRVYVATMDGDDKVAEALETVRAALAEHSVASDLGPKLLATLTSLNMTMAKTAGSTSDGDGGKPKSGLDRARDEATRLRLAGKYHA